MSSNAAFEVVMEADGYYYYQLKVNGRTVLRSLGYKTRSGCVSTLGSLKEHSQNPDRYDKDLSAMPRHRFKVRANRGRVVGLSPAYETLVEYERALVEVQQSAPTATVDDKTAGARSGQPRRVSQTQGLQRKLKTQRPATGRFRIYAAPLGKDGRYGASDDEAVIELRFDTEAHRDAFWKRQIVGNSARRQFISENTRHRYEYLRANFPPGKRWHAVGGPRYANELLVPSDREPG